MLRPMMDTIFNGGWCGFVSPKISRRIWGDPLFLRSWFHIMIFVMCNNPKSEKAEPRGLLDFDEFVV